MKRGTLYALALLPQVLLLAALVARSEHDLAGGTRVVLEVRAVDPMDLFSGRYVSTPLAIGRIAMDEVFVPEALEVGQSVLVRVVPGDPYWTAAEVEGDFGAAAELPTDYGVWMRATVTDAPPAGEQSGRTLGLQFGLERFFIPETAADPSLWIAGERPALALGVRVGPDGGAIIEDLLVNGQSFSDWNREQPGH